MEAINQITNVPITPGVLLLLLPALIAWRLTKLINRSPTQETKPKDKTKNEALENKPLKAKITSLHIYPIKSCRGFTLPKATLHKTGLSLDRRWMLVDAKTHVFLTIRQIPEMTLINTALSDDGQSLIISVPSPSTNPSNPSLSNGKAKGKKVEIHIPAHPTPTYLTNNTTLSTDISIWKTVTDGYIYNDSVGVNELLSSFLSRDVVLVYKGPTPRVLTGNGEPRLLGRVQSTNFPDVHPLLIASEASMAELNGKLKGEGHGEVSIERFRPNVVVGGVRVELEPWVEDWWGVVRISNDHGDGKGVRKDGNGDGDGDDEGVTIDIVARCARCQVPNVDPDTAEKHKTQPWDTLMGYRRVDEGMKYKPCFGMLGAPRNEGEISVGMELEVLEVTREHRYIKGF